MTPELHKTAAYGALHNTAETLRGLVAAARSSQHPLVLTEGTIAAIGIALNALHTAQREMEANRMNTE
jgi:hypothetical protein